MDRVVNNDVQPQVLENGTIIPAGGTSRSGPQEVELSEKDRRRLVESGRLSIVTGAVDSAAATSTISQQGSTTESSDGIAVSKKGGQK